MHMLSERTQVLLTPEQRERIERLARERGISVGAVIREAVDAHTLPGQTGRETAADNLFRLDAPVADWEVMKAEIIGGALGAEPDHPAP